MKSEFLRFKRLADKIKSELQLLIDSVKSDISLLSGSTNDEINNLSARVTQIEGNPSAEFSGTLDSVPSGVTNKHLTSTLKTNYDAAYSHSQSTHAPSNADNTENALKNNGNSLTTLELTDRLMAVTLFENEPNAAGYIEMQNLRAQLKAYFDSIYSSGLTQPQILARNLGC